MVAGQCSHHVKSQMRLFVASGEAAQCCVKTEYRSLLCGEQLLCRNIGREGAEGGIECSYNLVKGFIGFIAYKTQT